jgi:hypothetical protein
LYVGHAPSAQGKDPARCAAAGVQTERIADGTVTKPRLAQAMSEGIDLEFR